MKLLIIDSYYEDFLNGFYNINPELKNASYAKQKGLLLAEQFGTADFYSRNLKKLGYEAEDFIINDEILQKQWAKENGIKYRKPHFQKIPKIRKYFKSNWMTKILEAQILKFRPDIIYVKDLHRLKLVFLEKIKKYTKLLVRQIACKLPPRQYLEPFDLIISSLPNYVETFRGWGIKSEYLPLGFESTILKRVTKTTKQYDVVHIGGYGSTHDERNELLEAVAKKVKIDFWGYGIERLAENSPILKNYHGQVWGLDMYNILYNSKITMTKHITSVAANYANNMTLYEATGCGCLLITDLKDNLNELFEIGKEVETYSSDEELTEKIKYYLAHEDERKRIAQAGQSRTLKDHTYENRMRELIEIFNKCLQQY
jgi:spore maturation protein CgeB